MTESDGSKATGCGFSHTCLACRVVFSNSGLHRDHFKTDWHRYNLKRKMAGLVSVSSDAFRLKVVEMTTTTDESNPVDNQFRCQTCAKAYQTQAALANHSQSKKHLELVAKNGPKSQVVFESKKPRADSLVSECDENDEDFEDVATETESVLCGEPIPVETCLFCNQSHRNMDDNLAHMSLKHGFFVVDADYCTDLEGLVTYLGQKVGEGLTCVWCNDKGRRFRTLDAVQKHMLDKGHCRMYHDNDAMLEYSDFYDFSSSYPDNLASSDNPNGPEDESVSLPVLEENGYELVLPSGATIGHRSLFIYYKQNIKPCQDVDVVKRKPSTRLLNHYKSIGWTGTSGEVARRKERDLKFLRKICQKQQLQVAVKANKLQKHFRSQNDI